MAGVYDRWYDRSGGINYTVLMVQKMVKPQPWSSLAEVGHQIDRLSIQRIINRRTKDQGSTEGRFLKLGRTY